MTLTNTPTRNIGTEDQVLDTSVSSVPTDEVMEVGLWGALSTRIQNIFWNYMGLQAQMGLYGTTDQFDDP